MNEILRKQLWRELGELPDEEALRVLDHVRSLPRERESTERAAPGVQRFGELFQDALRRGRVPGGARRAAMRAVGAAGRLADAFREAGRQFLAELERGRPEPPPGPADEPPRRREVVVE